MNSERRHKWCSCHRYELTDDSQILQTRLGCPIHCPAPPSPCAVTARLDSAGWTIEGRDRHDPWRSYQRIVPISSSDFGRVSEAIGSWDDDALSALLMETIDDK